MADAAAIVVDAWIAKAERDLASASRQGAATEPHMSDALEAIDCAERILDHVRMVLNP
jgi:hypothetical protein